jgi:hypothetical protein
MRKVVKPFVVYRAPQIHSFNGSFISFTFKQWRGFAEPYLVLPWTAADREALVERVAKAMRDYDNRNEGGYWSDFATAALRALAQGRGRR